MSNDRAPRGLGVRAWRAVVRTTRTDVRDTSGLRAHRAPPSRRCDRSNETPRATGTQGNRIDAPRATPSTWELRVTIGRYENGRPRSLTRTVRAKQGVGGRLLAEFVDEMTASPLPGSQDIRDTTVDEAIDRFLEEYLANEKGRAEKTINDYRYLHQRWFSPTIGPQQVKRIDSRDHGPPVRAMRQAGLSASRLNQAKSLYVPFFRWAKRRGMTTQNPMADSRCRRARFARRNEPRQKSRNCHSSSRRRSAVDPRHRTTPGAGP